MTRTFKYSKKTNKSVYFFLISNQIFSIGLTFIY